MRYFIDTEFSESGPHRPIDLISIGIVSELGSEYYAVSSEFDPRYVNDWVKENVIPHLGDGLPKSLAEIADDLRYFIGVSQKSADRPEFWGYYCDYDWVVFCQIFGRMIDLPTGWPMFCRDLKQFCVDLGNPELPKQSSTEHNALNDARWNKTAFEFLQRKKQGEK